MIGQDRDAPCDCDGAKPATHAAGDHCTDCGAAPGTDCDPGCYTWRGLDGDAGWTCADCGRDYVPALADCVCHSVCPACCRRRSKDDGE